MNLIADGQAKQLFSSLLKPIGGAGALGDVFEPNSSHLVSTKGGQVTFHRLLHLACFLCKCAPGPIQSKVGSER